MAEIASPASDPRSLRRHYPHQVQGVRLCDVSAKRLPRIFFLGQNKTHASEVNGRTSSGDVATLLTGIYPPAGASFKLV